MFCYFKLAPKTTNTHYPEGKPLMRGGTRFSIAFRDPLNDYNNKREINSARRFTPNLMKMWRK